MSRSRLLYAAAALATALTATVLAAGPSTATAEVTPKVGQCRNLTDAAVAGVSDRTPAMSCSATHNARTIAMPKVPKGVDYRHIGTKKFSEIGISLCTPALWRALGGSRTSAALTAYDFVYFAPTKAQRAHGARWVRCDLVLLAGKTLAPLPAAPRPVLKAGITDSVRRCLTGDSWSLKTACASPHAYRSTKAFLLKAKSYPSPSTFIATGERRCPDFANLTWPSKNGWKAGDRAVVCFRETTS